MNIERGKALLPDNRLESTPGRDISWDILRAGAILYIVAYWHLCSYSIALQSHSRFAELITYCVLGLFCFLSGFLLSQRYAISSRDDIIRFYRNRALRIYPMYFISLTTFLFFRYIDFRTYVKSVFLANMILNQDLLTLWFVTMIFMCYLITPVYLKSYGTRKTIVITVVVYALLVLIHICTHRIDLRLPQYLPVFAFGIIAGRSDSLRLFLTKRIVAWGGVLFSFAAWGFIHTTAEIPRMFVTDLAIFLILPIFLVAGRMLSFVLNHQMVEMLSYASFAMYLVHRITFKIGVMIFQPVSFFISIIYFVGFLLPVTIAVAYGFQKMYDTLLEGIYLNW